MIQLFVVRMTASSSYLRGTENLGLNADHCGPVPELYF